MGKQLRITDIGNSHSEKEPSKKNSKVKELQAQVEYHQHLYYNKQPKISDAEFDTLWDELKQLDPSNEVFSKVGADFDPHLEKITHIIPMNSQDKVTSPQAFLKWAKKRNYPEFLVQYKLDGISIELQYVKGSFQYGVSRGDGIIGARNLNRLDNRHGSIDGTTFRPFDGFYGGFDFLWVKFERYLTHGAGSFHIV